MENLKKPNQNSSILNKTVIVYCFLFILIYSCSLPKEEKKDFVDYVNPYMGNISHLLVPTYPTIHLPNSFLRVYPNRSDYTGDLLNGLPVIVVNHRFRSAFTLSPFNEITTVNPVINYSYDREKITPYSYQVFLDEQEIEIDYAVSHQSALYRISFEKGGENYILLSTENGMLSWDGEAISGYQIIDNNNKVFVYLKPEFQPEKINALEMGELNQGKSAKGRNAGIVMQFNKKNDEINIRYGISFIDIEQARRNMVREVEGVAYDKLVELGRNIWNKALGKIEVSGGNEKDRKVFYTSLYRCYERPVCVSEEGRYYSPFDRKVHDDLGRRFYTDDWIWDTYQAHHPLRILIDHQMEEDILNSYVLMAEQSENLWMPTFPRITGDLRGMDSNHGVATILDAYKKGLSNFDLETAYDACKGAVLEKSLSPWSAKPAGKLDEFYKEHGYIPELKEGELETHPEVNPTERRQSVTVTLGTSFDEWCLSQMAKELELKEDYKYFAKGALNYRNLFNPETKLFHPKDVDGNFLPNVNYEMPGKPEARGYYGENNAWVYSFDVKHNIPDLIDLMGGNDSFTNQLDKMFAKPLGMTKFHFYRNMPDHTGNVGQFSMGNEPSFHIPYLYNYAGQSWKTQKRIRSLLNQWFRDDLMGVPGDEDGGGMSAFVVFSLMGIYPVTPGIPEYTIGSPAFESVKIHLSNGNTFEIDATNLNHENKYIQSARISGNDLNSPWIQHNELINGGKLALNMGNRANREWGLNRSRNEAESQK